MQLCLLKVVSLFYLEVAVREQPVFVCLAGVISCQHSDEQGWLVVEVDQLVAVRITLSPKYLFAYFGTTLSVKDYKLVFKAKAKNDLSIRSPLGLGWNKALWIWVFGIVVELVLHKGDLSQVFEL